MALITKLWKHIFLVNIEYFCPSKFWERDFICCYYRKMYNRIFHILVEIALLSSFLENLAYPYLTFCLSHSPLKVWQLNPSSSLTMWYLEALLVNSPTYKPPKRVLGLSITCLKVSNRTILQRLRASGFSSVKRPVVASFEVGFQNSWLMVSSTNLLEN